MMIGEIIKALEDLYGVPEAGYMEPVDLLIQTILSQNTSDLNSGRAFRSLKISYPDNESILAAPELEIAEKIRSGGLADLKAGRIKAVLLRIKEDRGSIDLSFMRDMTAEAAREFLLSMPGVGPKTAAIVMLFGFGMSSMPVDTHVYRVSRRLGLVPERASVNEAQRVLEAAIPKEKYLSFHINLIRHGRNICRARSPLCDSCALKSMCCFGHERAAGDSGKKVK